MTTSPYAAADNCAEAGAARLAGGSSRIDVEPPVAHEAEEREAELAGQLHGQGGRRSDGDHGRYAQPSSWHRNPRALDLSTNIMQNVLG